MSLETKIRELAVAAGTDVKALRTLINGNAADLSALTTTAKGNLVLAINELVGAIAGASAIDDGVISAATSWSSQKTDDEITAAVAAIVLPVLTDLIDDEATATDTVWSSTNTAAEIQAAVDALVGSAPGALDTIQELAAALGSADAITTLTAAVGNRVRYDAVQSLTSPQQAQARTNIGAASATGVGDTEADFVADYNTAKV